MATCVWSPESLCRRKEKISSTKFETDKWGQWCDLKLAFLGFILVCETGSPIAQPSLELTTWLGWPWTHDLSLSTSQVLALQACTTTADLYITKGRTQGFVYAKLGKHFWLSHVPSSNFSFDLEFKINGPFYDQAGLLLWAWPPYTRFSNTNQPGKSDPFLQCLRLATFPPNYNNYTMTQTPMGLWSSFYHSWKASWAPRWLNQTSSFMESFFFFVTHGEENAKHGCVGDERQMRKGELIGPESLLFLLFPLNSFPLPWPHGSLLPSFATTHLPLAGLPPV